MKFHLPLVAIGLFLLIISGGGAPLGDCRAQNPSTAPGSEVQSQKLLVIFKTSATEQDKERVRKRLKADVTARFADPNVEELTIKAPKGKDMNAITEKSLATARKDPAVQNAQKSAKYKLN